MLLPRSTVTAADCGAVVVLLAAVALPALPLLLEVATGWWVTGLAAHRWLVMVAYGTAWVGDDDWRTPWVAVAEN
ncbi:hypothetical protein RIF29_37809 [Crotalaria pallida]|uniref:Uncharacterized protein n=1 Tax=Crotalaria pallida TaxID=3830 RepID=A0AAN9E3J0_CROPI